MQGIFLGGKYLQCGERPSQDKSIKDSEITLYDAVMCTQRRYNQPVLYCLILQIFKGML